MPDPFELRVPVKIRERLLKIEGRDSRGKGACSVTAKILDGKRIARELRKAIAVEVAAHVSDGKSAPLLAAILVGDDPASQVYVRNKERACAKAGIQSRLQRRDTATTEERLLEMIRQLNADDDVNGILIQLPLPDHISEKRVLDAVCPWKDVDVFHPENVGLMMQGRPRFLPCTPAGIQQILTRSEISVAGKHVVIVGRSEIVGKPLAAMLVQRDSEFGEAAVNATVTVCHSRTEQLDRVTRCADVLVAAVGRPRFITRDMVQPGAVVIDVGINRLDGGLVGDVDFSPVAEVASHITPVPGGVGPLTIAMLLRNTLTAAKIQASP